jgi:hypothetical protein
MSSYPGDWKWTKIDLFLEPSVSLKNAKNQYAVLPGISVRVLASHFSSVIGNFRSSPWGPEGSENIGKPSYFNLPPDISFTSFIPIKGLIDSLTVYISTE